MKTYIFTISFLNAENGIEYKTIKGVYGDKETAKTEAVKSAKAQKRLWDGSYFRILGKGKVALINCEGCSKVYQVQEMELQGTCAASENITTEAPTTQEANSRSEATEGLRPTFAATVAARLLALWLTLKDYVQGTWQYTIKPAAAKVGHALALVGLYAFRVLWFVGILCVTLAAMFGAGYLLGQCDALCDLPLWLRVPAAFPVLFACPFFVELLLVKISKKMDRATDGGLFNMY